MQDLLEKVSEGLYEGVFCTELSRLCRGSKIDQEIVSSTFTAAECKIITPSKTYDLANNEFDEEMVDLDRKSTRLNSSHPTTSRMPSSA